MPQHPTKIVPLVALLLTVSCSSDPTPTLSPAPTPTAAQTDSPQSPWVRERVRAILELYPFTASGSQWLRQYDLRQMQGQPGWFGSYGNASWAGVGQAVPNRILHELSHSYYGAFPVTGRPDLSWEKQQSDQLAPALRQYHEDLSSFMHQPPDGYEPLRDRFRNLPNLSAAENPDLFHFGEADLIYTVGGNLNLVPPILRKYFDQLLQPGQVQSWEEAMRWHLGLSGADARVAAQYIGILHFPLANYRGMRPLRDAGVPQALRETLAAEERQRLRDFAEQYELIKREKFSLVDAASIDGDFKFWRSLLREMLELHRKHPAMLTQQAMDQGAGIAEVMDTIEAARGLSHTEQVSLFAPRLEETLVADFLVLLNSRVLVDLFSQAPRDATATPVREVIGKFTEKLRRFTEAADTAVTEWRKDASRGTQRFQVFLEGLTDQEIEANLDIIFDLLWEADRDAARELVDAMSDAAILRILENNPGATMNGRVRPQRLLAVLGITAEASRDRLTKGIASLLDNSSGNAQIDTPFTDLAYEVLAERGASDPQEALRVLKEAQVPLSALPLSGFIVSQPRAASAILGADLEAAADLVADRAGYGETPHRVIHTLIFHDPALAAKIVLALDAVGKDDIVADTLIVFAYDARRLAANSELRLSLEKDKRFLEHLMDTVGAEWVQQRMTQSIRKYDRSIRQGDMDETFMVAYADTLRRIIDLEGESTRRQGLQETFDGAFNNALGSPLSAL